MVTPERLNIRPDLRFGAGATHIIFSVCCRTEDRARHIEAIAKELIPSCGPAGL